LDTFQDKKSEETAFSQGVLEIVRSEVFTAVSVETYQVSKERTEFRFVRNVGRLISADSIHVTYTFMTHSFEVSALLTVNLTEIRSCERSHSNLAVVVDVKATHGMCLSYFIARVNEEA
jgi:hypothetical protein